MQLSSDDNLIKSMVKHIYVHIWLFLICVYVYEYHVHNKDEWVHMKEYQG